MQLHISPSLRHVTVLPGKGVRDFIKVKVASRKPSYRMLFYFLLFMTFVLRFVFVWTAMDTIDGANHCSSLGCLGKRLGPKIFGRNSNGMVPEEIYRVLEEEEVRIPRFGSDAPESLEDFVAEMRSSKSDAKSFALRLKAMVRLLEQKTRISKIQEMVYRHVASTSLPKPLHCLALRLAAEHSRNSAARAPLPPPEVIPALTDNFRRHFILASDNVLAAGVAVESLIRNAHWPESVVVHVITDRKTHAPMHAWFALRPHAPAVVEVKALHQFEWFTRRRVPVLEVMERDREVRSQFRRGPAADNERPLVVAAKLQALSPKYNSIMNHVRIYLPELFPNLKKVVFLDDDIIVQADLSPLWEIDLHGKVNGAVETCRGNDKFVMSKRLKNYLNFSHPLISKSFNSEECAWAYGMNIFDLDAWRKTSIKDTYHKWIEKNLESRLSLWQLGTLPPGLIAFHGHVHVIDSYWHMLGLGYQENTTREEAEKAAVIHFNGRAKPWLDIAFPQLRPLWTKYINYSEEFIKACNIRP